MSEQTQLMFAPNYPRNEQGWIEFPRDLSERRKYLPESLYQPVSNHPSKMNLFLCQEIWRYVSKPEDTILDIFGGVGTTLYAATEGRNVVTMELEPEYLAIQNQMVDYWTTSGINHSSTIILGGDNRQLMPFPCDHVITSPPYGNDVYRGVNLNQETLESSKQYANSNLSIGRLNPFLYVQSMAKVYRLLVKSVRPGGSITITHRDRSRDGRRVLYANDIVRQMTELGMTLHDIQKWKAPGSQRARVHEAKGEMVITDEDILMFRKPK